MKKLGMLLCAFASMALWSGSAHAAGYAFWEQGAGAMGRASAVVASPIDASTGFHNPAGLADLGGLQIYLGGTYVLQSGGYTTTLTSGSEASFDRANRGIFPPNLHLYYGVKDKWAVGFSFFNAFGLGLDWGCTGASPFPGCSRIDRVDLKTPTLQPSFSWRPSKEFSLGVGVTISSASAELARQAPIAPFPPGQVLLGADGAIGVGGVFGILYTPAPGFRIGVNYRSAVKYSFDGKADFSFDPTIPASVRANLPSDQPGTLEITTPHVISAGIAWDITKNFTLELDFHQYFWSVFEELRLKFGPPPAGGVAVPGSGCRPPAGASDVCSPRSWQDVPQFRLGAEWRATPSFTLRGGYIFDLTPVPSSTVDPVLPDANRHDFSIGFGYQLARSFRLDFAYLLVYFTPRNAPTPLDATRETRAGEYNTVGHLFGLNFGLSF